jgi:hypothetical protein
MASTYTSDLKIEKIGDGEQAGTWGNTTNQNFEALEDAICGKVTLITSDFSTNVCTLSLSNSNATADGRFFYIQIDATFNANATLNLPAINKDYVIFNNNPGDFHVTAKISGQAGIVIPKGMRTTLYVDGTDVRNPIMHQPFIAANIRTAGLANDALGSGNGGSGNNWALLAQSNDEHPAIGAFGYKFSGSDPSPAMVAYTNQNSGNNLISFLFNTGASLTAVGSNAAVGAITTNGSATSYATSSDYRLKENLVPLNNALNRVNLLSTYRFNFKSTPTITVDGFIAHEVAKIVPEAVNHDKDQVDSKGKAVYQTLDQAKLVPILVKAIQELSSKVDALETRIQTLEAK